MYGQGSVDELVHEQIDGEDPIWEVERVEAKKGKGRSMKYLIK